VNSLTADGLSTDMAGLSELVGAELGPTEWVVMTQDQVDQFADLTGDHKYVHVDPARAKETPFGGTIAHAMLCLSLLAPVAKQLHVSDAGTTIHYGFDRVRFPAAVPVGGRWRGAATITDVTEIKGDGLQAKLAATVEIEGSERPAVAAECLIRFYA
jgi:acyl dehydratase